SSAYNNGGTGISTGGGATVRGCSMSQNGGNGMTLGVASSAMDCTITDSGQDGVRALRRAKLSGVVSSGNVNGFAVDDGVTFENCSGSANSADGFTGLNGCVLMNCTAESNG